MKWNNLLWIALLGLVVACNPVEPNDPKDETNVVDWMPKSAKRGVAFSFTQVTDLPLMSPYISWDYNWGNAPTDNAATWFDANEMDFAPCAGAVVTAPTVSVSM